MNIIGYCAYCKEKILEGEEFEIEGSEVFHSDSENNCLKQKETFHDPFDDRNASHNID